MRILRNIFISLLVIIVALAAFFHFYIRPRYTVPVLMYHSISEDDPGSMYVKPENFRRQMDFLEKAGYSIISLEELVEGTNSGRKFPYGTVVITFDDGFEDNYLNAFPVMAKYNFPATIFLITGYVGEKEGYMNWDQVRVMIANGISFGGHTRNNVYLPSLTDNAKLWEEISGSKKDIEQATGSVVDHFCYPIGGFNDNIKNTVKKAGYKGACTTNRGNDRYNKDVFEINRVKITNSDTTKPFNFRAKLSGYYNFFRSLRSPE
jgi:peptidoglycan/xylan/chitin deacetylase (PgdA/CDA1 family)